ncbi:MAG: protein-methionine-sulfoxide reductase catalytic subunit MsrP [Methylococcaceae bacterium]|nr:protein-methionine-sulfoxide reductase catalytic subunit MsrP [Methylococcaceae bacterium]
MLIKTKKEIPASEITAPEVFKIRRTLLKSGLAALSLGNGLIPAIAEAIEKPTPANADKLQPTPLKFIQNYTNYYEFSYNKEDTTHLAQKLTIDPWSVEISGAVEKPGIYHLEDLLQQNPLQERVYRFRCVEAWAMVIPWLGFPLADLLKRVKPTSKARFVEFTSVLKPEVMPNANTKSMLVWPYQEALRIDEAMHPLTLLATGMYGESLAKQNGAPLRLVVPWKYGFKSIKAIVKIHLSENQPISSWTHAAPDEYGFYANVNPDVSHPRWSQRSERVLASGFFTPRKQTELFNGYAEQVASLYANMDLKRYF